MILAGVIRIRDHYCIDVKKTGINNPLDDRASQDWEQQLDVERMLAASHRIELEKDLP